MGAGPSWGRGGAKTNGSHMNRVERLLAAVSVLLLVCAISARADAPLTLEVWPAKPPGETGDIGPEKIEEKPGPAGRPIHLITNVAKPTLTIYRPITVKDIGAAVVICPGGAYSVLAWDLEGEEVAHWLNSIGVTGIILKYRVPHREGTPRHRLPLMDAQRTMSVVRSKASGWGIDPKRIGILGFSAGGNLAAYASTHFDDRAYESLDDVDKVDCRPDFAVLVYPAWLAREGTAELLHDLPVTKQTPPVFFAHANDDPITSASSVAMYLALKRAGVPAELHVYAAGGHGFGLRPTNQPCSTWPQRCEEWLRSQGIFAAPVKHNGTK